MKNESTAEQQEEEWAILDKSALIPTKANLPQIMKEALESISLSPSGGKNSTTTTMLVLRGEQKARILQGLKEATASSPTIKQEIIKQAEIQRIEAGARFTQAWKTWEEEASPPPPGWVRLFDNDDPYDDAEIQAAKMQVKFAEATLYLSNLAWEGGEALNSFLNWAEEEKVMEQEGRDGHHHLRKKSTTQDNTTRKKDSKEEWFLVS